MTEPKPSPRIITTPSSSSSNAASPSTPALASSSSASRHKHRGSFASPIEVLSKSPTARRMSQSAYSQSGTVLPEGMDVRRLSDHPVFLAGTFIASIMFCGIVYSLIFSTSLDTSLPTSLLTRDRPNAPYLARKSNIPNQLFVKYSWAWTSLAFIAHFISSPPSSSSRFIRLAAFGLNTVAWLVFTTWFFGAGLGDRVIALSGGRCGITVPSEWGLRPSLVSHLLPAGMDSVYALNTIDSGAFLLPLPTTFCSSRVALTPITHPRLFETLKEYMDPQILPRTRMPQPRWHKGFDISGHAFLLTLAALLLIREVAPSWKSMLRTTRTPHGRSSIGRGGPLHALTVVFATGLIGLWLVMLGTTAVFFHNPSEKLSGLGLGLATSTLINILTPYSSSLLPRAAQVLGSIPEDENSARRGRVVDDGVILDNDVDEALSHSKSE